MPYVIKKMMTPCGPERIEIWEPDEEKEGIDVTKEFERIPATVEVPEEAEKV